MDLKLRRADAIVGKTVDLSTQELIEIRDQWDELTMAFVEMEVNTPSHKKSRVILLENHINTFEVLINKITKDIKSSMQVHNVLFASEESIDKVALAKYEQEL